MPEPPANAAAAAGGAAEASAPKERQAELDRQWRAQQELLQADGLNGRKPAAAVPTMAATTAATTVSGARAGLWCLVVLFDFHDGHSSPMGTDTLAGLRAFLPPPLQRARRVEGSGRGQRASLPRHAWLATGRRD